MFPIWKWVENRHENIIPACDVTCINKMTQDGLFMMFFNQNNSRTIK